MDGSSSVNWLNQLARKMTGTAGVVVVGPQEDTTHTMNTQRVLASLPACPPTSRGMCAADGILALNQLAESTGEKNDGDCRRGRGGAPGGHHAHNEHPEGVGVAPGLSANLQRDVRCGRHPCAESTG